MSTPQTTSMPNGGPAFANSDECRAWLASQPLASMVQMQSLLQRQLGLLNRHTLPANDRLNILETLREQLYRTQEECQARFARRPVPLALPEQAAFDASQATWRAFADGYLRCLESMLAGDAGVQQRGALILERILATLVDMQADIYRSSQLPTPTHWRNLHQCYETAEELGLAQDEVKDRLRNPDARVSVASTYVEAVLLHAASPFELGQRQMSWVARWSRRWSSKVAIGSAAPSGEGAVPFYVALDSSEPASHKPLESPKLRVLDTADLRHSLKKRMHRLSQGDSPADLQLGEDCNMPAAGQLLQKSYQRWCKDISPRRYERRASTGNCLLAAGFESAQEIFPGESHALIPGSVDISKLLRERERQATVGDVVEAAPKSAAPKMEDELWQILDQSASGLRLQRGGSRSGAKRIAVGMLVGIKMENHGGYLLGSVRWTLVRTEGEVEIGIQMIPGQPQGITVGTRAAGARSTNYERALLLPAVAALKETSTLIIPQGWFEPGKLVELRDGKTQTVRLGQPLERGRDFDRVTFTEVSASNATPPAQAQA